MAESVDATVSNTVGETHPGSTPGPGTREMQRNLFLSFLYVYNESGKIIFWNSCQYKNNY